MGSGDRRESAAATMVVEHNPCCGTKVDRQDPQTACNLVASQKARRPRFLPPRWQEVWMRKEKLKEVQRAASDVSVVRPGIVAHLST